MPAAVETVAARTVQADKAVLAVLAAVALAVINKVALVMQELPIPAAAAVVAAPPLELAEMALLEVLAS